MKLRLRTSERTDQYMETMQKTLKFSTKAALARIAIGYSVKQPKDPMKDEQFNNNDVNGFEFQRPTLTGDDDDFFKAMVIQKANKPLSDEEYYPTYLKAHLERGMYLLYSEYKYLGSKDKFIEFLLRVK